MNREAAGRMDEDLRRKVAHWTALARAGAPFSPAPPGIQTAVTDAMRAGSAGMEGARRRAAGVHGVRTPARVAWLADRADGAGHYVFETPRGTVLQPRTPHLSRALSGLRMGELVVDEKAAREILGKFGEMDAWVRAAEDARRSNPRGAESSDLTTAIEGYWAAFDRDRGVLDALKAKANKAILTRAWQSASDKELETLGAHHTMARELDGLARATAPPPPGAGRPAPGPPAKDGLGALATVGLALAVASAMFGAATLVHQLTKHR